MSAPLVVVSPDGSTLHWVQRGRLWRADRLCRDSGFSPWAAVDDWRAGPRAGRVLTDAEVRRLVAPHGEETSR